MALVTSDGQIGISGLFELSTDQDYFHRIWNMEAGEKGLRDLKDHRQEKLEIIREKKEKERDDLTRAIEQSAEVMDKIREEKIRKFNGVTYNDVDLDATIKDIIDDKDVFAEKYGLNAEEADRAEFHALMMVDMTPDERARYLEQIANDEPTIANAISDDLETKFTDRQAKSSVEQTASLDRHTEQIINDHQATEETFVLDM